MSDETWTLRKVVDHVAVAEMLLVQAEDTRIPQARRDHLVAAAQVHATLAGAVASTLELVVKRGALDQLEAANT